MRKLFGLFLAALFIAFRWLDRAITAYDMPDGIERMYKAAAARLPEMVTPGDVFAFALFLAVAAIFIPEIKALGARVFRLGRPSAQTANENLADVGFSVARQKQLISVLKEHEGSNVKILFANVKHRNLAETLISVFELSGWETNLTKVPLEAQRHEYIEGIEIVAYNKHLLDFVCGAFIRHGLPARPNLQATQVKRDNPKWPWIQRYIKITIGHH